MISNARTALGVGEHTAEVRHCNAVGGCSEPLSISFTVLPAPTVTLFQFNPAVMVPGDTSNVWPVPSSVTDVYLDVTFSPSSGADIAPGYINVNRINQAGNSVTVLGAHQVDNEADDALLTGITAGSMVQVQVDEDAFHAGTPEVRLKFHDGTDSTGDVIAQVVVEIEDKPSTPQTGSATVDGFADTVTLGWAAGPKGNALPHHYEVSVATGSGFSDSNVTDTSLTIRNARTAVGIGIHRAEVRHCNEAGGCSGALEIPFRVPYSFTPNPQDPLELGEGTPLWTAPSDVTEVFVDVEFSPGTVTETAPGYIEIHLLDLNYLSLGAYTVDHADDDGALEVLDSSNVQHTASGGSSVRINAGKDAFASAAEMKIKLHSGNDATGDQIAVATVKTQTRPATPVNGRSYEQPASNAVVLEWYPGTAPAGASPDHYEVVIPGAASTDPDLYANLNVPQLTDPTRTVALTIPGAMTALGVGAHTAQVRHCNSAGGCSEALSISLTVSASLEITISDLAGTIELGASDPFTVNISNPVSTSTYGITVETDNNRAGFNADCTDRSETLPNLTGGTTYTLSPTLHACGVGNVSITATVTAGTNTLTTSMDVTITVPTVLSPPTNLQISVNPDENQQLDVTYDLPIYPVHFQFEISRNPIETGSYTVLTPQVDHASPAEFTNMDIGYWYQVRARNCLTYTTPSPPAGLAPVWGGCSPWSGYSSPYLLRLFKPTGLTVTPLPLRQAKLSWDPVGDASGYEVGLEDPTSGTFTSDKSWHGALRTSPPDTQDGKTSTNSIIIDLDAILGPNSSYDFQVKAIHSTSAAGATTTPGGGSEPSEAITIIDNPLLQPGASANGNSPTGNGQVVLTWNEISHVTEYTIKYRKLGRSPQIGSPRSNQGNDHHTDPSWPDHDTWPYYGLIEEEPSFGPGTGTVSKTITGLTTGEIYAFQVNYVTNAGKQVFSGRDAYVYPSKGFPGEGLGHDRVATFPLFGHWENKEYLYTVCDSTFPSTAWKKLIIHAFEQWEHSTSIVTMTPSNQFTSSDLCDVAPSRPLSMIRSIYNEVNEVFMVDTNEVNLNNVYGRNMSYNLLFNCVYQAPACAISPVYFGNQEASKTLTNDKDSVDILINQRHDDIAWQNPHSTPRIPREVNIPGNDENHSGGDVKFNKCVATSNNKTDFYLYETMVHESGHALGLSGFSLLSVILGERERYVGSHSTIPDSVMNYDYESIFLYDPSRPENERWIRREPDCSPHPFDIMVIHSLYQTVP